MQGCNYKGVVQGKPANAAFNKQKAFNALKTAKDQCGAKYNIET